MASLRSLTDFEPVKSEIAALFAARVAQGSAPGCFFSVFDEDGPVFEGGFGCRTIDAAAPDRQTRFRIASCTKSFTTAALLILRDAGQLARSGGSRSLIPFDRDHRFRWIAIIDSGDRDHWDRRGAGGSLLTVFN